MITLTGGCVSEDKNGNMVLSGKLNTQCSIYVFKNMHKQPGSKQPDYLLKIAKYEKEKDKTDSVAEECPF